MSKIKTIIFDFGDVFINLDKEGAMLNALDLFKVDEFEQDMLTVNIAYETGEITTDKFIDFYRNKFNYLSRSEIIDAWNYILKDFPKYRLEFLQELRQQSNLNLILLSNTNELHIELIKAAIPFYAEFKECFDAYYLSHEINRRKPNKDIFEFVLNENSLIANECLFIDDTAENTRTAVNMGMNVWNIDEKTEDVIDLFNIKKELF